MKNVLILSDTHNFIDDIIIKHASEVDLLLHAGDFGSTKVSDKLNKVNKLIGVYGNIDGSDIRMCFPKDILFEYENKKIYMTHICGKYPSYPEEIRAKIIENKPNILICGHSHILKIAYNKKYKLLHINPGAAGIYGFHKKRTMVKFQIEKGEVKNIQIIETDRK